jgi:hypothetical protein
LTGSRFSDSRQRTRGLSFPRTCPLCPQTHARRVRSPVQQNIRPHLEPAVQYCTDQVVDAWLSGKGRSWPEARSRRMSKAVQRSGKYAALFVYWEFEASCSPDFFTSPLHCFSAPKLLLSRNVTTKASKMLPTKRGSRATSVRHPSAQRRLIRRSRRKSSKTRPQRQKIELARTGRRRDAIVRRAGQPTAANVV